MQRAVILLAVFVQVLTAYGQGQVVFNTRVVGVVDAPVWIPGPNGLQGPGPSYSAQLYLVNPDSSILPLLPVTVFRGEVNRREYVYPVDIIIPGLAWGSQGTFFFRFWETSAGGYEQSLDWKGQSDPVTIIVGPQTPSNLVGLKGITVPEPSTVLLAALGAVVLLLRRGK